MVSESNQSAVYRSPIFMTSLSRAFGSLVLSGAIFAALLSFAGSVRAQSVTATFNISTSQYETDAIAVNPNTNLIYSTPKRLQLGSRSHVCDQWRNERGCRHNHGHERQRRSAIRDRDRPSAEHGLCRQSLRLDEQREYDRDQRRHEHVRGEYQRFRRDES